MTPVHLPFFKENEDILKSRSDVVKLRGGGGSRIFVVVVVVVLVLREAACEVICGELSQHFWPGL